MSRRQHVLLLLAGITAWRAAAQISPDCLVGLAQALNDSSSSLCAASGANAYAVSGHGLHMIMGAGWHFVGCLFAGLHCCLEQRPALPLLQLHGSQGA